MKKILFAASEATPFISTGGLADVIGSLPAALNKTGKAEARVVIPLYKGIKDNFTFEIKFSFFYYVQLAWRNQYCGVWTCDRGGVTYYFLDNEYYFYRDSLYGHCDDGERFAFFGKAVVELLRYIDYSPDILHTNDWQTAMSVIYLKEQYKNLFNNIKTVYTIHNIEYQGIFDMSICSDILGLPFNNLIEYDGNVNFTKGAIDCCDLLNTVSNKYSKEILSPEYSCGLHYILRNKSHKLYGVLNGIDTDYYNPETDLSIYSNYSASSLEGKALNKAALQESQGLPVMPSTPIFAIISRLTGHKGLDLVTEIIEEFLEHNIQFVILGKGEAVYENYFKGLESNHKDRVRVIIDYNKELAKKIYAGSDIFVMPSRSEPCGLSQMIASRYGTVPLVRETGGLSDTIQDCESSGGGNGFTFSDYNASELLYTLQRAESMYYDKEKWSILIKKVMDSDFSWGKSAGEYLALYEKL